MHTVAHGHITLAQKTYSNLVNEIPISMSDTQTWGCKLLRDETTEKSNWTELLTKHDHFSALMLCN